jgi:hypothetical protein
MTLACRRPAKSRAPHYEWAVERGTYGWAYSRQRICFNYALSHYIFFTRSLTLRHHEDPSQTLVGKSAQRAQLWTSTRVMAPQETEAADLDVDYVISYRIPSDGEFKFLSLPGQQV